MTDAERTSPGPVTMGALRRMPARWVFDDAANSYFPDDDFFRSFDWHIPQAVIERARLGLEENIGPDQLRRLVERRDREQRVIIRLIQPLGCGVDGFADDDPGYTRISVQHWSRQPRRIGPLITGLQLDPRRLVLTVTSLLDHTTLHANGTEYLDGQPLVKGPDIEELGSRWCRRREAIPPDWTAATTRDWTLRWRHMPGPGSPWAALAGCWNTVAGPTCPLCEFPTLLWGFGQPLDAPEYPLGGQRGMAETVCVACGMRFQQPIDDLEGWLVAHLEPALRPLPLPGGGPSSV